MGIFRQKGSESKENNPEIPEANARLTGQVTEPIIDSDLKEHRRDVKAFQSIYKALISNKYPNNSIIRFIDFAQNRSSIRREIPFLNNIGQLETRVLNERDGERFGFQLEKISFEQIKINQSEGEFLSALVTEGVESSNAVEKAQRDARAFNSILFAFTKGDRSIENLEVFTQRYQSSRREIPFLNNIGQLETRVLNDRSEERFRLPLEGISFEQIKITESQASIIESLIKERAKYLNQYRVEERDLSSSNNILQALLEGNPLLIRNPNLIDALAGGSISSRTEVPFLERGRLTRKVLNPRSFDSDSEIDFENVRLTERDALALREIRKCCQDPNEAISSNFKNYLRSALKNESDSEELLKILKATFISQERSDEFQDLSIFLENFIETQRVRTFKVDVLRDLRAVNLSQQSLDDLVSKVESFSSKNAESIGQIKSLFESVLKRRDIYFIEVACLEFNKINSNDFSLKTREMVNSQITEFLGSLQLIQNGSVREALTDLALGKELSILRKDIYYRTLYGQTTAESLEEYFNTCVPRLSSGSFDYIAELESYIDRAKDLSSRLEDFELEKKALEIRDLFESENFDSIFNRIKEFPTLRENGEVIKIQLIQFYREFLSAKRPAEFQQEFGNRILELFEESKRQASGFEEADLGKNKEAFEYLLTKYNQVFMPLFSYLKNKPETREQILEIISNQQDFRIILNSLEKIRQNRGQELTLREKRYLKSVELLSNFNPLIAACLIADKELVRTYLGGYFETKSKENKEKILNSYESGEIPYFPILQIGLGPNGLASLGEIARQNPSLATSMLTVDVGNQPGGPFAVPGGDAWRLNSKNAKGYGRLITDSPEVRGLEESKTVRGLGSPTRFNPGERVSEEQLRGDINQTVDYSIGASDFSTGNYATNTEFALLASAQAALVSNNISLGTKVLEVKKNDTGNQGAYIVTLQFETIEGTKIVKIATDAVFNSTGLGDPLYGVENKETGSLAGTRAKQVLDLTRGYPIPKVVPTLEGFKFFVENANRYKIEKFAEGDTIVIWGGGDSASILAEYLGKIFDANNASIRNIKKIYIVTKNTGLSPRPRYASILDLRARNGRDNLIEIVDARVADFGFATQEGDPNEREIILYDRNGKPIVNSKGEVIQADLGIAACGFKSRVGDVYADFISEDELAIKREPISLPEDSQVVVGESLAGNPDILFVGTAATPVFNNRKLAQLTREAREALLRNGAENAVAVGFIAPEVQAAINIFLSTRDIEGQLPKPKRRELKTLTSESLLPASKIYAENLLTFSDRNSIDKSYDIDTLNAFLLGSISSNEWVVEDLPIYERVLDYQISYNEKTDQIEVIYDDEDGSSTLTQVFPVLSNAINSYQFQKAFFSVINTRRRNKTLKLTISFTKSGRIDFQNTFIE